MVPIYIDNSAFQRSAAKGWSHGHRLQCLCRHLFEIALKYECVFEFDWLASAENNQSVLQMAMRPSWQVFTLMGFGLLDRAGTSAPCRQPQSIGTGPALHMVGPLSFQRMIRSAVPSLQPLCQA